MSTKRTLPETWKCRDGRVLLIREMSDDHIRNTLAMLRSKGVVSMRAWQDERPQWAAGFQGEFAQDAAEQSYYDELEAWAKKKHSAHMDAFHLEMAYRKRHGVSIKEARVSVAETVDEAPEPRTGHQWTLLRGPQAGDAVEKHRQVFGVGGIANYTAVHRAQVLEAGIKAGSGNPGVQVLLLDSDADQILVPLEEFIRCWAYVPPAT